MKTILKTTLLGICFLLLFFMSPRVFAWITVNKHLEVTLVDIEEPYWFDLLFYSHVAPEMLSEAELEELLPEDYAGTIYSQTMNGYQDVDGYISFRLYSANPYSFNHDFLGRFEIGYQVEGTFPFKLAIIYPNGTIEQSAPLTQTKENAIATYEASLVQFEESDTVYWPCCDGEVDVIGYRIRTMLLITGIAVLTIALQLVVLRLFGYKAKKLTLAFGIIHAAELLVLLGWIYVGILRNEQLVPLLALISFPIFTLIEALIFTKNIRVPFPYRPIGFVLLVNFITVVFLFTMQIFI